MRRRERAFTLIELAIAIFILLLMLLLAVPSMQGVIADRNLRRSLDDLNNLVRMAQDRSVTERRAYLIAWQKDHLVLRPETFAEDEATEPTATMQLRAGDALVLALPAALTEEPPAEWIFWPSGTCEPAEVTFKGVHGTWKARYGSLTVRAEISDYVAN